MRFRTLQLIPEQVGRGGFYFPVVGLILGSVLVLVNRVLEPYLESEILSATLVAVLALMTGAIHYEGVKGTFDALSARSGFNEVDKPSGVLGFLAIFFVVLLKVRALEVTGETRSIGLLLSPVFARWALVILLCGSADATEGAARRIAANVRAWHLVFTTLFTLSLASFLIGRTALWIGLCISLLALLNRSFLRRRNGTIRYENFGAVIELSETLTFILFSTL